MTTFEDILSGKKTPKDKELLDIAKRWLKKEYEFNAAGVDPEVLKSLLAVHDHSGDGANKHFAHPELDTSVGRALVQIAHVTGHWHLTFSIYPTPAKHVIHPKSEGPSWFQPANREALALVKQILTSGTLAEEPIGATTLGSTPKVFISGNQMQLYIPDDSAEDLSSLGAGNVNALLDFGDGHKSISIDLGAFVKDE